MYMKCIECVYRMCVNVCIMFVKRIEILHVSDRLGGSEGQSCGQTGEMQGNLGRRQKPVKHPEGKTLKDLQCDLV